MEGDFDNFRKNKDMGWPERHFSDYKQAEFLKLLNDSGFKLIELKTVKVHWGPTFIHFFAKKP